MAKGKIIEVMPHGNPRVQERFTTLTTFEKWMRLEAEIGIYDIFYVSRDRVRFEVTLHKENKRLWLKESNDPCVILAFRYYNITLINALRRRGLLNILR